MLMRVFADDDTISTTVAENSINCNPVACPYIKSHTTCAYTHRISFVSWRAIYVQRAADNKHVTPYMCTRSKLRSTLCVWVSVFMVH